MHFTLEEHIHGILQAQHSGERIEHMWLHGFAQIAEGKKLSEQRVNEYLARKAGRFPRFTPLTSSSIMMLHFDAMRKEITQRFFTDYKEMQAFRKSYLRELTIVHLPFHESYHFEIAFLSRGDEMEFMKTSCGECESLSDDKLPYLTLRRSVKLETRPGEPLWYDNRESASRVGKDILVAGYYSFQDFIQETSLKEEKK